MEDTAKIIMTEKKEEKDIKEQIKGEEETKKETKKRSYSKKPEEKSVEKEDIKEDKEPEKGSNEMLTTTDEVLADGKIRIEDLPALKKKKRPGRPPNFEKQQFLTTYNIPKK